MAKNQKGPLSQKLNEPSLHRKEPKIAETSPKQVFLQARIGIDSDSLGSLGASQPFTSEILLQS
jgi:hypothetical protein